MKQERRLSFQGFALVVCGLGIAFAILYFTNPPKKSLRAATSISVSETVFSRDLPHELLGTFKTMGCYGNTNMSPLLITVYGEPNRLTSRSDEPQRGYRFSTPGMLSVSSRSIRDIEFDLSTAGITGMVILPQTDTTGMVWETAKAVRY